MLLLIMTVTAERRIFWERRRDEQKIRSGRHRKKASLTEEKNTVTQ